MSHYIRHIFRAVTLVGLMGQAFDVMGRNSGQQETLSCGNKHKNLVRLQKILQGMDNVKVPDFFGIPTEDTEAFLRNKSPLIFDDYPYLVETLTAQIQPKKSVKPFFIASLLTGIRRLTAKAYRAASQKSVALEQIITQLRYGIKNVFIYTYLVDGKPFEFTAEELSLIEEAAAKNQFFMVRSTGEEDSQTVANAGGNVSLSYVVPNPVHIVMAMGDVVASYFGIQSLKNRIAGGDDVSSTQLCLPVLIQLLVGEKIGGAADAKDIPISGVAFTTNPTLSAPDFPVTEINAAYGHGEGVVASRVTTDRYYITPSRAQSGEISIYPILSHKEQRLVPKQQLGYDTYHLALHPNPRELANKSALSYAQLQQLYAALKAIEADYQQPMDVEFVILGEILYIVQARPAMRHKLTPSYFLVEKCEEGDISDPISGTTLVSGAAQLLTITDPADLIVTSTLDEADQMPTSGSCKAVMVGSWASSLSHAAVNFTSHGIPCFFVQDFAQCKQLLKEISPRKPLIVDPQRGLIFLWNKTGKNIAPFIAQGWFEHPVERALSLMMEASSITTSLLSPMPQDAKLIHFMEELKAASSAQQQKDALQKIVTCVETRLHLTVQRMVPVGFLCDQSTQQGLAAFTKRFRELIAELSAAIDQGADHFEILFYHKMIEALLYQQIDGGSRLNSYTYSYFLNSLYAHQAIFRLMQRAGYEQSQGMQELLTYADHCPSRALAQQWQEWVMVVEQQAKNSLGESAKTMGPLQSLLAEYNAVDALPLWFATEFYQATSRQIDIKQFTDSYTLATRTFLQDLKRYRTILKTIDTQRTAALASFAKAEELSQELHNSIVQPLTSDLFINSFKEAPLVAQLSCCEIMRLAIDTMDTTIKGVKTSPSLNMREKVELFVMMLNDFNQLFRTWIQKLMPEHALKYHSAWPLADYLAELQTRYEKIIQPGQINSVVNNGKNYFSSVVDSVKNHLKSLINRGKNSASTTIANFQRSPEFSVNSAMLGSVTAFERHFPKTAEDIFMLIHQNSLITVAALHGSLLTAKPLPEMLYLPKIMQDVISYIETSASFYNTPHRIGLKYTPEAIELYYNVPLNNHSSTFQIMYDQTTQQCIFAGQFVGEARARWEQVALLAAISPDLSQLELIDDVILDTAAGITSWKWVLQNKEQLPCIVRYFSLMGSISFGEVSLFDACSEVYSGAKSDFATTMIQALNKQIKKHGPSWVTDGLLRALSASK